MTSRYAGLPQISVDDGVHGPVPTTYASYSVTIPGRYSLYVVQPGDRWDKIAFRLLGDPSLWWKIADINPELFDPRAMRPGVILRVPSS